MNKSAIIEKYWAEFAEEFYKDLTNLEEKDPQEIGQYFTEPYFWVWYGRIAGKGGFDKDVKDNTSVKDLGFSPRVANALASNNILTLVELRKATSDFYNGYRDVKGVGKLGWQEIDITLEKA